MSRPSLDKYEGGWGKGGHTETTQKIKARINKYCFSLQRHFVFKKRRKKKGFGHDEYEVENTSSRPFQERDNSRVNSQ